MNAIYWNVTTSVINADGTYVINVESNISDLEYRKCDFIQQPWFNTFPKVGDTVLLLVVNQWQYAILGIVSYNAKQYMSLEADEIRIISPDIKIQWGDVVLTWDTITANWRDITVDNT